LDIYGAKMVVDLKLISLLIFPGPRDADIKEDG
jgi:hypothetical protein